MIKTHEKGVSSAQTSSSLELEVSGKMGAGMMGVTFSPPFRERCLHGVYGLGMSFVRLALHVPLILMNRNHICLPCIWRVWLSAFQGHSKLSSSSLSPLVLQVITGDGGMNELTFMQQHGEPALITPTQVRVGVNKMLPIQYEHGMLVKKHWIHVESQ